MVSFRNLSGGMRSLATYLLFGLKPTDAATFLMALAVQSLVAVAVASLPPYRAASIHPMSCLRNQ